PTRASSLLYTLTLHDALPISRTEREAGLWPTGHVRLRTIHQFAKGTQGKSSNVEQSECVAHAIPTVATEDPRGVSHDPTQTKEIDRKSTRLNSSHVKISYAVF